MERATARETAEAGRAQFEAGRYAEAIDSFTRAQQLVAAPPHLLYLARAQAKLGRLVEAHENYLKITRDSLPPKAPKAFTDAVNAAERELEALDARLPYVTITVQGAPAAGVTVQMDGVALPAAMVGIPLPIDPGTHAFEASGSAQSAPVTVTLAEGAKETVMLTLRAIATPKSTPGGASPGTNLTSEPPVTDSAHSNGSGLRVGSYVAFGVGAIGLGLGAYFLVQSSQTRDTANNQFKACAPDCLAEETQIHATDLHADRQRNEGIAALVVGGVGAISGVTLLLLSSSPSTDASQSRAPRLTPVLGFRSLGLAGTF